VIELQKHIEILLLNNDCVIVPDFGGFVAHHVDARYDESDGTFLPPLRTIGFNPQLKINDSFLVQSYVEAYDISYPEALCRIENEVGELKQLLADKGKYELSNIGILYLNEEGKCTFEPCEAGLLTPTLYGLSGFDMELLTREQLEAITESTGIIQKNTLPPTVPANSQKTENARLRIATISDAQPEKKNKTINIKVSFLRNVAAACIAVIAFLFCSIPLGSNKDSRILKSNMEIGLLTKIMPKDITNGAILHIDKKKIIALQNYAKKGGISSSAATKAKNWSDPDPYYCIVLASRVTLANATYYVKQLQKKGYDEARVYSHKGLSNKVIYGKYTTEQEAYHALNHFSSRKAFSDGWVLKVKDEPSETCED
jgi:septal ring-binding cell division protein DamX